MAKRKTLAILYPGNDWATPNTNMKDDQRQCYLDFFDLASREYGLNAIRVSKHWYTDGYFDRAWMNKGGKWTKVKKKFRPDIIMDKASLRYDDIDLKIDINSKFLTINPWELDLLSSDKLLTNATFAEFAPPTFMVRSKNDLPDVLKKIKSREVVLKPRLGFGGKDIQILSKAKAKKAKIDRLTIVQPMVKTDDGIPGLYKGIHDFRVIYAGEKAITAYIRTPAPGTKLCNISQGGGVIFVPVSKIPKQLKPALKHVLRSFEVFPHKVFSVDFFFENGKPLLVELNTKPLMYFPEEFRKDQLKMHHGYLDYFASLVS